MKKCTNKRIHTYINRCTRYEYTHNNGNFHVCTPYKAKIPKIEVSVGFSVGYQVRNTIFRSILYGTWWVAKI